MSAASPPLPGTGSFDRGLSLFAAIIADDGATPLSGLAARLALAPSTARRLAASLERHRLIARVGRGRYAAGAGLAPLAAPARRDELLARVARAPLRRLARTLGVTAHLGVLAGDMVTYLVKERAGRGALFTREREQLEAYCSGVGKVLLAGLAEAPREAYLAAGGFVPLTGRTIVAADALRAELDRVRARGFAIDDEEVADGLYCVAVPVRGGARDEGALVAAISVSGPVSVLRARPLDEVRAALGACAAAVERRC